MSPAPGRHRRLPVCPCPGTGVTGTFSSCAVAVSCCSRMASRPNCVRELPAPEIRNAIETLSSRHWSVTLNSANITSPSLCLPLAIPSSVAMWLRKGLLIAPTLSSFRLFCLHAQGGCIDASLDRGVGRFKVVFQIAEAFTMPIRPHHSDQYWRHRHTVKRAQPGDARVHRRQYFEIHT
ncbi:hypothetical protein F5Y03DRAFT_322399 [Xylaria venustula]|nr:hypothetical protein F5Y03DRAFT_322399 [Xylaria venustula]